MGTAHLIKVFDLIQTFFWGLSYLYLFWPWLPDAEEFVANDAVPMIFSGAHFWEVYHFFFGVAG